MQLAGAPANQPLLDHPPSWNHIRPHTAGRASEAVRVPKGPQIDRQVSADSVEKRDLARVTFLPERVDDRVPGFENTEEPAPVVSVACLGGIRRSGVPVRS